MIELKRFSSRELVTNRQVKEALEKKEWWRLTDKEVTDVVVDDITGDVILYGSEEKKPPSKMRTFVDKAVRTITRKPAKHWLLENMSDQECRAFEAYSKSWAGDMEAAASFLINDWMKGGGLRWLLQPAEGTIYIGASEKIISMLTVNAKLCLEHRALLCYKGILDEAIRQTVRDQLNLYGLPELVGNV